MSTNYDIEVFDQPGLHLEEEQKRTLQADLCKLSARYLNPLPAYQVFDTASPTALDDKIIVTVREDTSGDVEPKELVAFVSAVLIPIEGLDSPVLHTGLTVIHEKHRKSAVKRLLFSNLLLVALGRFPEGFWLTSLAEVLTSLVHIAQYTVKAFPAPQWEVEQGSPMPSDVHLKIARQISAHHRAKMCISPTARFDEKRFVFLGSNDWPEARVFMKDIDDRKNWHGNTKATRFFRRFFRRGCGDEVLQVAFMNMSTLVAHMENEGYAENEGKIMSKL